MQFVWIAILAAVIVTRRFSPFWGGVLGALAAVAVGAWGVWSFEQGGRLSFLGTEVPRAVFLAFVAAWLAFEIWGINRARRLRRRDGD